ncbi:hypothetical protein DSO57_1003719 [Entomophthora muscae]|uniref:Uncharacterized protein n=1 Tax=Entomophthora muscae TaxID=34485 RepID=A0ACC2SX88_9FUNG|nr:hypothetical protein DSO57_1003719 [Entomophthora muscae]
MVYHLLVFFQSTYQANTSIFIPWSLQTSILCLVVSVFLLAYLGPYTFLGQSDSLLGRYPILGEVLKPGYGFCANWLIITGLIFSEPIHHVKQLFPAGWTPDISYAKVGSQQIMALMTNLTLCGAKTVYHQCCTVKTAGSTRQQGSK